MKTVFVLSDCVNYEGCRPWRVFQSREAAEALKAKAEAYDKTCPKEPNGLSEDKPVWEDYFSALAQWRKNHPVAEGFQGTEGYVINELPFEAVEPKYEGIALYYVDEAAIASLKSISIVITKD